MTSFRLLVDLYHFVFANLFMVFDIALGVKLAKKIVAPNLYISMRRFQPPLPWSHLDGCCEHSPIQTHPSLETDEVHDVFDDIALCRVVGHNEIVYTCTSFYEHSYKNGK